VRGSASVVGIIPRSSPSHITLSGQGGEVRSDCILPVLKPASPCLHLPTQTRARAPQARERPLCRRPLTRDQHGGSQPHWRSTPGCLPTA